MRSQSSLTLVLPAKFWQATPFSFKICSIFSDNGDLECGCLSGFSQIFSIIASKILDIFIERNLKVKLSNFKFFENEMFFDRASSGIFATLNAKESQTGVIFISK